MDTIQHAGCLVIKDNKILLVSQGAIWTLPGGIIESGLEPEDSAKKNAQEQIGARLTIVQEFDVLQYQHNNTNINHSIFECTLDFEVSDVEGQIKWFDKEEIQQVSISPAVEKVLTEL